MSGVTLRKGHFTVSFVQLIGFNSSPTTTKQKDGGSSHLPTKQWSLNSRDGRLGRFLLLFVLGSNSAPAFWAAADKSRSPGLPTTGLKSALVQRLEADPMERARRFSHHCCFLGRRGGPRGGWMFICFLCSPTSCC